MSAKPRLASSAFENFSADEVLLDLPEREAFSSDVYSRGVTAAAVLRPRDKERCAAMVAAAADAGFAVIARGGGLSYTGGYLPVSEKSVILDLSRLDRIIEVSAENMYITVEAGVTWKQIQERLAPLGLRLPFFGTFSGAQATVGGGLSNGALFHGTARYGTAADNVLGMEVVLADGSLLRTGQRAFRNVDKPFYRTCGPDLTGLFMHDSGSFGIKVEATFRLIQTPAFTGYASFVFDGMAAAGAALSAVARTGAAEEAYVFDPESTRANLRSEGILNDAGMLLKVMRNEGSFVQGLLAGVKLAAAGRSFLPDDAYSLHLACTARSEAALHADLHACREACAAHGGAEIADSIPRAVRANPFPPPDGVLGADGHRWAALNAKVAHSDAPRIMAASAQALEPFRERMQAEGVWMTHLLIAIGTTAFSFEPVFRWRDEWLPVHSRTLSAAARGRLTEPSPQPGARALVAEMRQRLVDLFAEHGAASNQLGKTYPYFGSLRPESARFVTALKQAIDPAGCMNPGALGLDSQRHRD
ncbi:MAG: FAD-binding oxidoreductase [Gammaproteobacteria bacterium]|nr:FAD-binding oxidoreductase [Gammaproteobacteria bacterium]